ncbi:hypothetical protein GQ457_08G028070 [Hibiscus cannabinus]
MSESHYAQINNTRGSSSEGGCPVRDTQNPPDVQTIQRECLLSMKEMFDQFVKNIKLGQSVVQAVDAPSRAPIEKFAQHRGYPFTGTIEEKPEEAEYWLERITHIFTKQMSCSDEHKLECAVALLVDKALSWWEPRLSSERNFDKILPCKFCQKRHRGLCRIQYNLCYAFGRDDHFIRDCPRNIQKILTQPPVESSFTPPVWNESSKKVQFGNQGRGKGDYSKASTHQESRAPVRFYHIEGRNNEKSLEVITEESVQNLDQEIKRLGNMSLPLVNVLWKNHGVEEVTWETEATIQEQYPHLFNSRKNSRMNSLLRGGGRIVIPRNSPS